VRFSTAALAGESPFGTTGSNRHYEESCAGRSEPKPKPGEEW